MRKVLYTTVALLALQGVAHAQKRSWEINDFYGFTTSSTCEALGDRHPHCIEAKGCWAGQYNAGTLHKIPCLGK